MPDPASTEITFPWSSLDALRFTQAYEDRSPIEHAGRRCAVLSRACTSSALREDELVMRFEIAYLADAPRASVTVDAASDLGALSILGLSAESRASISGAPAVDLPEGWTAPGDRSCATADIDYDVQPIPAWTDYPFTELGDTPGQRAPVREVRIIGYDGDKYATVLVGGVSASVKTAYLHLGCRPPSEPLRSRGEDAAPQHSPAWIAAVEALAEEIDATHVGLTDDEIVERLRAMTREAGHVSHAAGIVNLRQQLTEALAELSELKDSESADAKALHELQYATGCADVATAQRLALRVWTAATGYAHPAVTPSLDTAAHTAEAYLRDARRKLDELLKTQADAASWPGVSMSWTLVCDSLGLVPDAPASVVIDTMQRRKRLIDETRETLAAYCPECDPGRTNLSGVVLDAIGELLGHARRRHNPEYGGSSAYRTELLARFDARG